MRSKLPSLSSRQLISALRRAGFEDAPVRGKGSHHALMRRDLPPGTLNDILSQAGLTTKELADLL